MGKPVNSLDSPRFCGIRTFQRLPTSPTSAGNDFAILGVPFDTATTYKPGCRFGPAAIRDASSILKSYHIALDVDIFEADTVVPPTNNPDNLVPPEVNEK